jgi:hypothetical protein
LLSFAKYVHIGMPVSIPAVITCITKAIQKKTRFDCEYHDWQNVRYATHKRSIWGFYDGTDFQSSPRRRPPPCFRASTDDKVRVLYKPGSINCLEQ